MFMIKLNHNRAKLGHQFNHYGITERRRSLGSGLLWRLTRAGQRKQHGGQGGEDESAFHCSMMPQSWPQSYNPAPAIQSWKIRTLRSSSACGRQMNQYE